MILKSQEIEELKTKIRNLDKMKADRALQKERSLRGVTIGTQTVEEKKTESQNMAAQTSEAQATAMADASVDPIIVDYLDAGNQTRHYSIRTFSGAADMTDEDFLRVHREMRDHYQAEVNRVAGELRKEAHYLRNGPPRKFVRTSYNSSMVSYPSERYLGAGD